MRMTGAQFRDWEQKSITLLGMSGRIGTRYLDEPILDNIKQHVMQIPFLQELLRSDSIHIVNNLDIDNLQPLSTFLGKVGDPASGGLNLKEFKRRQELHRLAEVNAMNDVPEFIRKAHEVYGYSHFVNDAGGSLCEMEDKVIELLAEHSLILYIKATEKDEKGLIARAEESPKPLYYQETFLDEQLHSYMKEREIEYIALIDPDDFVRWVFPELFRERIPRYEYIADNYGYSAATDEILPVQSEEDFIDLMVKVLDRS